MQRCLFRGKTCNFGLTALCLMDTKLDKHANVSMWLRNYFTRQNALLVYGLTVDCLRSSCVWSKRWRDRVEKIIDMSYFHLAQQTHHSLTNTWHYGREISSGRQGHVGGFRSTPVQRHIAAHLAAAAAGAWENTDQLPEPQPQRLVQSVREPGGGSAGQTHATRAWKRLPHMFCYVTVLWDCSSFYL